MIGDVIGALVVAIIELFFVGTGEFILFIVTLGKRKPVWKREEKESSTGSWIFLDLSCILGAIFWLFIAWLVFNKFSN